MSEPVKLTVVKSFTYRTATEEYSNTYHLSGANPADPAAWQALFDAVVLVEKPCLPSSVHIVGGIGYAVDSNVATWSVTLGTPVAGTLTSTGGQWAPGDSAVWVRWDTGSRTSKGKPIFLRKYFHPGVGTTADLDVILPAQKTALTALGAAMYNGTSLPTARKIVGPAGDDVIAHLACSYLTTRTLKRRGRRHPSS